MNEGLPYKKSGATSKCWVLLLTVLLLTGTSASYAQQTVTGRVTGEEDTGLPGVNIVLKGTTIGTVTDGNGNFSINASPDDVLVFSFIGYTSKEIRVGNQTSIPVNLEPDYKALDEVVVIGYGSQQLSEVTTAVAHVDPKDFVPGAVRNVGEAIRGKVPGLSITTASGSPNAETQIRLRGITSVQGSSSPLVLIDGYTGNLDDVSPNDIQSIDVLKDASASAIYGTRAANGVILITTKKVSGTLQPRVEYSGWVSAGQFARKLDFMTADDVREQISAGNMPAGYDEGFETDWLDEVTNSPLAFYNNVSLRAGSDMTNYVVNLTYRDERGLMKGSTREEFIGRFEVNQYLIKDKLKATVRVLHGRRDLGAISYGESEGGSGNDGFEGIYRQAIIRNPTDRIMNDEGGWQERGLLQYSNPVGRLEEEVNDNNVSWTWLSGGMTYYPIADEDFSIQIQGSKNQRESDGGFYQTKQHYSTTQVGRNGLAGVNNFKRVENFLDIFGNYTKEFGDHRLTAMLGYSYIDQTNEFRSITNSDFPTDAFTYNAIELGRALGEETRDGSGVNTGKDSWKLISFFGRIGYAFNDRYNVLASVRQEGSSKFGENNKWGTFPAVSFGWTISNEAFLANSSMLSNLKLRLGYGETGSVPGSSYLSLTSYSYSSTQFFFNNGTWNSILEPIRNPNPDLKWEVNKEINIGLDFGLFDNKFWGSIDYYNRTTEDLLFNFNVPVPPNLVTSTLANAAEMSNQGIEIGLNYLYESQDGDFSWTTNVNFSKNKNKLESISNAQYEAQNEFFYSGGTGPPIQQSTHRNEVGQPLGNFYGWKSVDIDENGEWIIENGDGERKPLGDVTPDDRTVLGNGQPTTFLAWNNTLRFKKFDLGITMRGAFDYQVLNYARMFYENPASQYNKLNSAFDLVYGKELLTSPLFYVSEYIEDGDYWKIDNVTLGYNFVAGSKFSGRVYAAVSNLAIISGYSGIDPEVSRAPLAPGNDQRDAYPSIRTYSIGFNFQF